MTNLVDRPATGVPPKRRNPDWGRPGPHTSEGMADLWRIAGELNQGRPGNGEWVPWAAIEIDLALLPRERLDEDAVARYAETFFELPPVEVQAGTLKLIDGRHRLSAAMKAISDCVRVIERDVSDDEMVEVALVANTKHGVPLNQNERQRAARKLLERHHPETGGTTGQAWTVSKIAEVAGVGRTTVHRMLAPKQPPIPQPNHSSPATIPSVSLKHSPSPVDRPHADEIDEETGEILDADAAPVWLDEEEETAEWARQEAAEPGPRGLRMVAEGPIAPAAPTRGAETTRESVEEQAIAAFIAKLDNVRADPSRLLPAQRAYRRLAEWATRKAEDRGRQIARGGR